MGLLIGAGGETYKAADFDPDSLLYLEREVARIEREVASRREAQEAALAEIRDLGT